jgi:hypothetical protein
MAGWARLGIRSGVALRGDGILPADAGLLWLERSRLAPASVAERHGASAPGSGETCRVSRRR